MDDAQFQRIAKALADPTRFDILRRIAEVSEMGCACLTQDLKVSQPTISHHLKELVNAGLLESRREAKFGYFHLRKDVWTEYLAEMARRIPASNP